MDEQRGTPAQPPMTPYDELRRLQIELAGARQHLVQLSQRVDQLSRAVGAPTAPPLGSQG